MKKTIRCATIVTAAAIAAMAVIGCNNGADGDESERVNSYLRRFDPPKAKYAVTFYGNGGGMDSVTIFEKIVL
jgi:uncharacterized lipoprotein NlpE involved in copper resistance